MGRSRHLIERDGYAHRLVITLLCCAHQTEISQVDIRRAVTPFFEQHIGGFDITMNQPLLVRILNGIKQLLVDGGHIIQGGQFALQVAGQRAILNEGHHQVEQAALIAKLDQR